MEFQELLRRRRMVRSYTGEPVPRDAIERIVATVRRAPSGGHSQGQRLVVTDPSTRQAIADLAGEDENVAAGREPWLSRAPVVIVVCSREEDYHERYRQPDKLDAGREIAWPVPYWWVDAGAALMLLLLAAIEEGYAAGVFGLPAERVQELKDLLGIPADVAFVAALTVGRAAEDPGWSAVTSRRTWPRKPLGELVRWERWTSE